MKKEKLTEILQRAAVAEGYVFHTGTAHLMNGTIRIYPAAWLEPPLLKSSDGRNEGDVTYRVILHLMALRSASANCNALWDSLEEDALAISRLMAADPEVTEVSVVSCTPAEQSLTTHGEVSVALVCDLKMWYFI